MPKHDKPEPPLVQGLDDLILRSAIIPGQFPTNLVGQRFVMKVRKPK